MSGRTLVLFFVAVMIAVAAVIVVKNRTGGTDSIRVLAAKTNIEAGSFVHADAQLTWMDWPQSDIPPYFVTSTMAQLTDFNGAVARRTILAGEPVTNVTLVRATEGGFLSAVLKQGKRAVSIAVNPTSGNAGFIFPGDKVDLILTHRIPVKEGARDSLASETFIEDARVLAIDQMLDNPENKAVIAKTVTLEVTPKQAEMINVATNLGSISLSLRSLAAADDSKKTDPAAKPEGDAAAAGTEAEPAPEPAPPAFSGAPVSPNFTTDNDVSKLMGDKSAVRVKVNVYHGSTSEQLDFQRGERMHEPNENREEGR